MLEMPDILLTDGSCARAPDGRPLLPSNEETRRSASSRRFFSVFTSDALTHTYLPSPPPSGVAFAALCVPNAAELRGRRAGDGASGEQESNRLRMPTEERRGLEDCNAIRSACACL